MHTQRFRTMALAAGLAAALAVTAAAAQPAQDASAPAVDPAAIAALDKMGAALRALDQFSLRSDAEIDLVLDSGQKIELDQSIVYQVRQPDKLRVDLKNAYFDREVFFDSGKLTVWAPQKKYYATTDVEAKSLGDLVANASDRYDLQLPLSDLFLWGTDKAPSSAITSAFKVADGSVGDDAVEHWAFRQEGVDWQVWISKASSLPRKVVITGLDDPSQPDFSAVLHWDAKTAIDDARFAFTAPADATKIALVSADPAKED